MKEDVAVYPYSIQKLQEIIVNISTSSLEQIGQKLHCQYFDGYCSDIEVQTIIVEYGYVDQHYLEDYAAYYVRCFHVYERFCARIHFFKEKINQQEFENCLSKDDDQNKIKKKLTDSYLGFVVIKPLPQTVIGRTCLKHYPFEERRYYPIAREYKASLCGIDLKVKSLAFQEQDRVVAACATSALWSVFHGTGKQFQHIIPSPVEITRAATERLPIETRTLPNYGLSTPMMAHAIKHVGLEPYQVNVKNDYVLKGTSYAYLRGKIPMIMGIELWDTSICPHKLRGYHAVAVTGFSLGGEEVIPYGDTDFSLRASRIDKIYVHDDQVGPFARMEFDGDKIIIGSDNSGNPIEVGSMSSSWKGQDGVIGSMRAKPTLILIPVYHKIRIPFSVIHDSVMSFDRFLEALKEHLPVPYTGRLEWDIFLTTNNEVKSEIKEKSSLSGDACKGVLLESMPRFLWRATALHNNSPILDLLFDATDIEQGPFFVRAIEYNEDLSLFLRAISKVKAIKNIYGMGTEWKVIEWFEKQPLPDLPEAEERDK